MKAADSKETERIAQELNLNSPERIEEALQYFGTLYHNEEIRQENIESKANILIAASVLTIAFVTGFLCLILYDLPSITLLFIIVVVIIYIIMAIYVIKSINQVLEISSIGKNTLDMEPFSDYSISESDIINIKKVRAANYFSLFNKIKVINDEKREIFNMAQKNIKNVIVTLLVLSLIMIVELLLSGKIKY
jgi:ABC-type multidrug transport system fused ATPase/permease subunit